MKTYRTNDGEVFSASRARDVVRRLRALSHVPEPTPQAFMEAVAARVLKQFGTQVATDAPAQFVADLIQAGLLIEVQE